MPQLEIHPAPRSVLPVFSAALVFLAGVLTLYFWYAGIWVHHGVMPGTAEIKANNGLGLIMVGCALWLQTLTTANAGVLRAARVTSSVLSLCVLLLGLATVAQDIFNVDLRIDQLFFGGHPGTASQPPGRMPMVTAISFVLAGLALMLLDYRDRYGRYPAEYAALLMVGVMGIPFMAYVYDVGTMPQFRYSTEVAPQGPVIFFLLAAGILAARPHHPLVSLWNSTLPGGRLMRRLLPMSLALLLALDFLVKVGERHGLYAQDRASPLVILISSVILFVLFCRAASALNREYEVRRRGELALTESNALLKEHEAQLEQQVAARTAEVRELIGHLESTREEEKRAIARELHDDLGSALTALNMHLAIMFQQMPAESRLTDRATQVKALLNAVTQTTRRIQVGLRPDKLDIFGVKVAIAEQAQEFENYTGVTCRASLPDEDLAYTQQMDIALFRLVQEALNNIAKHAKASRVDVVLDDTDEAVVLSIRDDGIGMPEQETAGKVTHGLRGMRERAAYLGGSVRIVSNRGKGTTVVVTIPKQAPGGSMVIAETSQSESPSDGGKGNTLE